MFNHLLADPTVLFSQPVYTTSESDGPLEVCVFINLELEVNVSAVIFSLDNTSTCKYNIFSSALIQGSKAQAIGHSEKAKIEREIWKQVKRSHKISSLYSNQKVKCKEAIT